MDNRYRIERFHAKSLEGNPLSSPVDRDILVYLPPEYDNNTSNSYPVIYLLHGYGSNNHQWTITSRDSKDKALPLELIPKKYLKQIDEALERIENETYGICRITGKLIQKQRLEAVPTTTISVEAKKAEKK